MTHAISVLLSARGDTSPLFLVAFFVFLFGTVSVQLFRLYNVSERFVRWTTKGKARDWPVAQASIDVATGIEREIAQTKYGPVNSYIGVLNYFYEAQPSSNVATGDDRHMGEFEKRFDNLDDAKDWAAACKGRTVKVHVNPRDQDESILLDEDVPQIPSL
jgi:hypothetical protein